MTGAIPSGRWEVLALRYASRPSTRGDVFYRYHEYGEPDGPQEMAYYFWLLRGPAGVILVDSGYSASGGRRRGRGHIVAPLNALAALGVAVTDVDLVINTHLHYDHTGHLESFAHAPLVLNATELAVWSGPVAERPQYAAHIEPAEVAGVVARVDAGDAVTLIGGEHPIADGIVAIEVGGHSPGQTILIVETAGGPVVLASDAVHFYEEIERDRACGVLVDLERVYGAYDTIRDHLAEPGTRLLAGHDPTVMERFEPLAQTAGVRLG